MGPGAGGLRRCCVWRSRQSVCRRCTPVLLVLACILTVAAIHWLRPHLILQQPRGLGLSDLSAKIRAVFPQGSRLVEAQHITSLRASYLWALVMVPRDRMGALRDACKAAGYSEPIPGDLDWIGRVKDTTPVWWPRRGQRAMVSQTWLEELPSRLSEGTAPVTVGAAWVAVIPADGAWSSVYVFWTTYS
jgi:hypothetical protein